MSMRLHRQQTARAPCYLPPALTPADDRLTTMNCDYALRPSLSVQPVRGQARTTALNPARDQNVVNEFAEFNMAALFSARKHSTSRRVARGWGVSMAGGYRCNARTNGSGGKRTMVCTRLTPPA
jgi:hypothetical protein